jgi:hypothetical protein
MRFQQNTKRQKGPWFRSPRPAAAPRAPCCPPPGDVPHCCPHAHTWGGTGNGNKKYAGKACITCLTSATALTLTLSERLCVKQDHAFTFRFSGRCFGRHICLSGTQVGDSTVQLCTRSMGNIRCSSGVKSCPRAMAPRTFSNALNSINISASRAQDPNHIEPLPFNCKVPAKLWSSSAINLK